MKLNEREGVPPLSLALVREPLNGTGPGQRWGRWRVVDDDGPVGFVVEYHHESLFAPSGYCAGHYHVAHNPSGEAFRVCWHDDGFATPTEALGALADHVSRCEL